MYPYNPEELATAEDMSSNGTKRRKFRDVMKAVKGLGAKGLAGALVRGAGVVGRLGLPAVAAGIGGNAVAADIAGDQDEAGNIMAGRVEGNAKYKEGLRAAREGRGPGMGAIPPDQMELLPESNLVKGPRTRRVTPQEEVGAPEGLDSQGEPFYAGIPHTTARVEEPIARTAGGTEVFQDTPGEARRAFSDRGLRATPTPVNLQDRLADLNRQYMTVRDENLAREGGFRDAEAFREADRARQINELRQAGIGEAGLTQLIAQGGLRGVAPENQGGSMRDQIALAEYQRKSDNDAFDRQARLGEFGLREQGVELQRRGSERAAASDSRDELSTITEQRASEDEAVRAQGTARAQEIILSDPESPAARTLITDAITKGDTGFLDYVLNGFSDAPRPQSPGDLSNFRIEGGELKKQGNQFVGIKLPADIQRLLEAYYNSKRGLR